MSLSLESILGNVERNSFDYATAYARTQSNNSTIISELVQAYTLIAKNQGISVFQFLQTLQNQGSPKQQALYLASQLNNVRPRNALLGIAPSTNTPDFISREIAA